MTVGRRPGIQSTQTPAGACDLCWVMQKLNGRLEEMLRFSVARVWNQSKIRWLAVEPMPHSTV